MAFKLGDKVYWTSQAQGFTKRKEGVVVAVVPAGHPPGEYVPQSADAGWFQLKNPGAPRDHETYLVRVGRQSKLYWPLVKNLHMDIRNVKQKFCGVCGNKLQESGRCDSCTPPVNPEIPFGQIPKTAFPRGPKTEFVKGPKIPYPVKDSNKNWENNDIQFPRLLAEFYAAGVTLNAGLMDQVCESMDLRIEEIEEILERAQVVWDKIKENT